MPGHRVGAVELPLTSSYVDQPRRSASEPRVISSLLTQPPQIQATTSDDHGMCDLTV